MTKEDVKTEEAPDSSRTWASAAFVGVLIIIGVPLWWKTTEVYRVSLPFDVINSFDPLSHIITTNLTVLANDAATADEIASVIEKAFENSDIIKVHVQRSVLTGTLRRTLEYVADEQDAIEDASSMLDLEAHNTMYVVQRSPLYQDVWLGTERVMFFRDSRAAPTVVEALKQWVYQTDVLAGARAEVADQARRTRFPPDSEYHIVLSVVHPRPDLMAVEFDAESALEDYIGSFVDELSELHNFTLKSQWLYLLDYDFQAKEVKDGSSWGRHWAARRGALQPLLARLEARAATHASGRAGLHLALYLTPCAAAPVAILRDDGTTVPTGVQAFLSPKWGGVVFASPPAALCAPASPSAPSSPAGPWRPSPRLVMGTFLAQLRPLLGIHDTKPIKSAVLQPLRSVAPRRWEVDNLLRIRTLEQLTSAERTLHSLAKLLGEISNIVINDEVGAAIKAAVESISASSEQLRRGQLLAAHAHAQRAARAAESAFTDPSLLALLYFPDDQKYAIYIPLFLPIMFPVVLSLKNLVGWRKTGKDAKLKSD